jgi:uncharacterized protein (DUF2164 family)
MGFNKRFINKETINIYLKNGLSLEKLFNSDAVIFLDKISSKVYYWYSDGMSDDEINLKLNKNGQESN